MENNLQNIYLFRAIEAYPWELEKAVEALNYALAYDPENVKALHLMAKFHYEQLGDYEMAKLYFESALASNIEAREIFLGSGGQEIEVLPCLNDSEDHVELFCNMAKMELNL